MLLMDEPFGALDAQSREVMHDLILHIHRIEKTTIVFVTHDVEEAIYLGQRVVVMAAAARPHPQRLSRCRCRAQRHQDMKHTPQFRAAQGRDPGAHPRELGHGDRPRPARQAHRSSPVPCHDHEHVPAHPDAAGARRGTRALRTLCARTRAWHDSLPAAATGRAWCGAATRCASPTSTAAPTLGAAVFNDECTAERYNMPDTLKAQHTAYLTAGHVLLLRHGPRAVLHHRRQLRLARHARAAARCRRAWSALRRQRATRSTATPCTATARDGLLIELGKWGLGQRDLVPTSTSSARWRPMKTAACASTPRTASPASTWTCASRWTCWWCCPPRRTRSDPPPRMRPAAGRHDAVALRHRRRRRPCRRTCPENGRGFINTERYYL